MPVSPSPDLSKKSDLLAFRAALAAWFATNQRPMDWRAEPSLYGTVVSEFMLQQTRVETVRPYFKRWVNLWRDFSSLAAASEEAVVKAWEGLGYYTRARNLRRLAIAVSAMPEPPRTAREWVALPGVGAYTAAAIASIACGEPVAVVDGNVVRVLSRLTADSREFKDNGAAVKAFAETATRLLDPTAPGVHNQAVMELGALVCLPRAPLCPQCPLGNFCAAKKLEKPESFPRFLPKKTEKIAINRIFCFGADGILLFRHGERARRLSGIFELPDARFFPDFKPASRPFSVKKRAISNQLITEAIYVVKPREILGVTNCLSAICDKNKVFDSAENGATGAADLAGAADLPTGSLEWVPLARLSQISLSGPHRKWISGLQLTAAQ